MHKRLFKLVFLAQIFFFTHQSVASITKDSKYKCKSDTIFIIDSSGSVKDVFKRQVKYVEKVISQLDVTNQKDHVALLVFSGKYYQKVKYSLNDKQERDIVLQKVRNLPYYGGTTLAGMALDLACNETKSRRPNVQTNIVVISDAFSFDSITKQSEGLRNLSNVRTFAVAIKKALESEMLIIAGNKSRVFKGFNTYNDLAKSIQSCSTNSTKPQLHGIVTKVKNCDLNAVIVLDSSNSVKKQFVKQLEMLKNLLSKLPASPSLGHISIIKFGGVNRTRVIVPLKNSLKNDEINKKLSTKLQYIGGVTYGQNAFQYALEELKSANKTNASKVVIVFTDGYFQDDVSKEFKALQDAKVHTYAVTIIAKQYPVNRRHLEVLTGSPSNVYTQFNFSQLIKRVNALTANC